MKRRQFLIAAGSLCLARTAYALSNQPILFWFYTSEQEGIKHAPVSPSQFEIISADLPCHGTDVRSGEPAGLDGWRYRIDAGEDLLAPLIEKCRRKLDALNRPDAPVFVGGVSRGAWAAFQLSIADDRFDHVLGLSPVVDLMGLKEFEGCTKAPVSLAHHVDILAQRSTFLSIESRDDRVGTSRTVELVSAIANGRRDADSTLIVERGNKHEVSERAMTAARRWIEDHLA
jgi:hypothetical protein